MQGHPPNHSIAAAQAAIKSAITPNESKISQMLLFHQDPAAGRTHLPYVIL